VLSIARVARDRNPKRGIAGQPDSRPDRRARLLYTRRMTSELRIVGAEPAPDVVARARPAARLGTLADVLRFGFAQTPPWNLLDVIVQDEFTHDVVIAGPGPAFLVLDTT
jgi:hypothetical protein